MNVKARQTRSAYIYMLHDWLMLYLDKNYVNSNRLEIHKLCFKNQALLKANTNTFIFEGKWYSGGDKIKGGANRILHISLKQQMYNLCHENNFEHIASVNQLSNYISIVLLNARHINDLSKLLPSTLQLPTNISNTSIFNIGNEMTEEEIAAFKEKYKKVIHKLNVKLLTDLLLVSQKE